MNKNAFLVLRIGLGITFIWIGILIFQNPENWAAMMQPWAKALLPVSPVLALQATAFLDVLTGGCLIIGLFLPLASLYGAAHVAVVLVTVGVNESTVRDIGLLGAMFAILVERSESLVKRGAWMEFLLPIPKR
jgi:uncharacterized membrane protein YphA (DoxX/SURF4 family)